MRKFAHTVFAAIKEEDLSDAAGFDLRRQGTKAKASALPKPIKSDEPIHFTGVTVVLAIVDAELQPAGT